MGFFGKNRLESVSDIEIKEAAGYEGTTGIQLAVIESLQNDYKIFEGALLTDMMEAKLINEGASSEQVTALQEGAIGDFWQRIKDFFIKLWEKIKAIWTAFMAKFNSVVMKSNKEYFNKYNAIVGRKNLKDLKVKYSEPKSSSPLVTIAAGKVVDISIAPQSGTNLDSTIDDFDADDKAVEFIKAVCGVEVSDLKSFSKDFHEACFEDAEEADKPDAVVRACGVLLKGADDSLKTAEKYKTNMEKGIKNIISAISKEQSAITKLYPTNDAKATNSGQNNIYTLDAKGKDSMDKGNTGAFNSLANKQKQLRLVQMEANCYQTAITKVTAGVITETKFGVAQARRIYAAAVAYHAYKTGKDGDIKESTILQAAMEEAAEYEVMSDFQ